MAANREYLQQLLETDRFYGGNNTVEQCIRLNNHDCSLENGGYIPGLSDMRLFPEDVDCAMAMPEVVDELITEMSYDECGIRDDVLDAFGV